MARKETITIDMILDTAFAMTREEGFANVTARKVAAKAGCSTQPIFRVYKNMDELWRAVYDKAAVYFRNYCRSFPKTGKKPFFNLGMAYISFDREESRLFELLFVSEGPYKKGMYELLNGPENNVVHEIALAKAAGCAEPGELFTNMWFVIHGAACMTMTGDCDLTDKQTMELLERLYVAFAPVH